MSEDPAHLGGAGLGHHESVATQRDDVGVKLPDQAVTRVHDVGEHEAHDLAVGRLSRDPAEDDHVVAVAEIAIGSSPRA